MKYIWRLQILLFWLKEKRNVSFLSLLRAISRPRFKKRASRYITSIQEEGADYVVAFQEGQKLYFPKSVSLAALYHVVCEICDRKNWHYYEIPETKVKPDDIVVDCGAAEGLFSLLIQDRCREVYVIEPSPIFLTSISKTFKDKSNVTILPVALGKVTGTMYLTNEGMESKVSEKENGPAITIETIDNLFFHQGKKITYLKADIEGYELEMLEGARLTIKECKPTIAITTYHHREDAKEITHFLKSLCPDYNIITKGIDDTCGAPIMLHAWI